MLNKYVRLLRGAGTVEGMVGPGLAATIEEQLQVTLRLANARSPGDGERWIDVGSGNGINALPLAVAWPEAHFTLMDVRRRSAGFMEAAIRSLGLENALVRLGPVELLARGPEREAFDVATARALGPLPVVVELLGALVRPGGALMVPRWGVEDAEMADARAACQTMGLGAPELVFLGTGQVDPKVGVVIMSKVSPAPAAFPRRPGVPARRPLRMSTPHPEA